MEVVVNCLIKSHPGTEWELQGGKCRLGKEPNKSSEFSLQKETKIAVIDPDSVPKGFLLTTPTCN